MLFEQIVNEAGKGKSEQSKKVGERIVRDKKKITQPLYQKLRDHM